MSSSLTSARMSYAASVLGCMTYGVYIVLACICVHFLTKHRRKTRAQRIILAYTILMMIVSTIYFASAAKWSEIEFVESTVDISVFDTLTDSRLAILKDTAYTVNIWLADSLLVYRVWIIWGGLYYIVALPALLWLGSVATGIVLLVGTARPGSNQLQDWNINFNTAFYCLSISLNILSTLFIAGRLLHRQWSAAKYKAEGGQTYYSLIAIVIESAALYSICGIIYIPLIIRKLPLQFPVTALIGSFTSIAPNLIILRMALGVAATSESTNGVSKLSTIKLATFQPASTEYTESSTAATTSASRTSIPLPYGERDYWGKDKPTRIVEDGDSEAMSRV